VLNYNKYFQMLSNNKFFLFLFFLAILTLSLSVGCRKDKPVTGKVPVLTTTASTFLNPTNVCTGGNITDAGSSPVSARGVCWSTQSNPTINDSCTKDGIGNGSFFSFITGLMPLTTYHLRAYASNSEGTGYGNQITITTPDFPNCGTVTDIDGNVYQTVVIGSQCWMKENLKTTRFNDGTPIPLVTNFSQWSNENGPAYCYYNNDSISYKSIYGALYKGYTHNYGQVCPLGWHVPTSAEFDTLITFLLGETVAGGKMKTAGAQYWNAPNKDATNESGFSALPGGHGKPGNHLEMGIYGIFVAIAPASRLRIYHGHGQADLSSGGEPSGSSVRCVKD
jgi:uncharacterized protein (TIGR02145 family)